MRTVSPVTTANVLRKVFSVKLFKAILAGGVVLALAGCATSAAPSASSSSATYAKDGTFTMAVAGDPGTLNPLNNTATTANWLFRFAYDSLVTRAADGKITAGLATKWTFDGSTAKFTIRKNATCSDGSAVTPSVIAKNFAYAKDASHPSTIIGAVLPNRNFSYVADDATSTFTLTLASPFSLLLSSLSFMPIVCGPAADNPATLTTTSSGSGPFVLTQATPNSQYVLTRRTGYTWGVDGGTTAAAGTPSTVILKIVPDETTAANLMVSGEVNAAVINGQDRARLTASGTTSKTYTSGGVVMSFNQAAGRITADKNVRLALTMAIDGHPGTDQDGRHQRLGSTTAGVR
jgi:peptide/nickel transport system substrate-binding protein